MLMWLQLGFCFCGCCCRGCGAWVRIILPLLCDRRGSCPAGKGVGRQGGAGRWWGCEPFSQPRISASTPSRMGARFLPRLRQISRTCRGRKGTGSWLCDRVCRVSPASRPPIAGVAGARGVRKAARKTSLLPLCSLPSSPALDARLRHGGTCHQRHQERDGRGEAGHAVQGRGAGHTFGLTGGGSTGGMMRLVDDWALGMGVCWVRMRANVKLFKYTGASA